MAALTLADIEPAVRRSWSIETCDAVDDPDWSATNPARGQCGVTALVLHDLLGGDLICAEVLYADGSRQGVHYWNRLPDGTEVDLTREQFVDGEQIQRPLVVTRPPGLPRRAVEQYQLLSRRVTAALAEGHGSPLVRPATAPS